MDIERIQFLETIIDIDASNVRAMTELGWLYFDDKHDYPAAVSTLERAHELAPDSSQPLYWLAKVYYHHTAHLKKSREFIERALKLKADDPASASLYGAVCSELGDASAALVPLLAAIKIEPSWVSLLSSLDYVYTAMDQLSDAIIHAKQAFRLANRFYEVSTAANDSYFDRCVTHRWVDKESLAALRVRAARKV